MKFETKFSLLDHIWVLHNGKAKLCEINSIEIRVSCFAKEIPKVIKVYFVNVGTTEKYECAIIDEQNAFETREQLIESL